MELGELLVKAVRELRDRNCTFALAGGLVASVYRTQTRTTTDADFLIYTEDGSQQVAEEIIKKFGFSVGRATLAQLSKAPRMNKSSLPVLILVGRDLSDSDSGLDFILPDMPWFEPALDRAQTNRLDFGFGPIPALTPEDIVISKVYAIQNDNSRYTDKSDIQQIFGSQQTLDLGYFAAEMDRLKLHLPKDLEGEAPKAIRVLSKRIRNKK
ncbi:nucleotidyl transferase AbiEii/AbiGii toxin family protein [Oligoflexia bacterium]|nr:nucleotidyl transferase AbiEii/AbiGii toxin family protein [Oligoflexia bacterium]